MVVDRSFTTRLTRFMESCMDEFLFVETGSHPGFHISESQDALPGRVVEIETRGLNIGVLVTLRVVEDGR
jgi:hypothetical protein